MGRPVFAFTCINVLCEARDNSYLRFHLVQHQWSRKTWHCSHRKACMNNLHYIMRMNVFAGEDTIHVQEQCLYNCALIFHGWIVCPMNIFYSLMGLPLAFGFTVLNVLFEASCSHRKTYINISHYVNRINVFAAEDTNSSPRALSFWFSTDIYFVVIIGFYIRWIFSILFWDGPWRLASHAWMFSVQLLIIHILFY